MLDLIQSDANLFGEIVATALFAAIFFLAIAGMRRGWRRRRGDAAARYGAVPRTGAPVREPDGRALCTGTTVAGSRLERVALPELFGRWRCDWWVEPGGLVLRKADGTLLDLGPVAATARTGAHAGRAVGRGRIALVRWTLNGIEIDTGLQFDSADEAEAFTARLGGDMATAEGGHA
jgi:hypothetical protein